MAYRHEILVPNKGWYFGLGSVLTTVRHLSPKSRESTSYHADVARSDPSMMSQTHHLDDSLLRQL